MWNTCAVTILSAASIALASLQADVPVIDPEIPEEIQASCEKWGEEYDICPEFLEAIIYEESRYTPDVVGGSCKGLMQINVPIQKDRIEKLGVKDIFDIDSNVHVGADLLAELFNDYSSDAGTVLMLYHGEKNAIRNGKKGKYSAYAQRVLKKSEEL